MRGRGMRQRRIPELILASLGAAAVLLTAQALLPRLLKVALRRDLRLLNLGDYRPLLSKYADDAVLYFHRGEHRFSGEHRGKAGIEQFLWHFAEAGLRGEAHEVFTAGRPWRMTILVRFDDRADGPDGAQLYANRAVLLLRTRWGRIVEHEDFFEDTGRVEELERRLRELGR